MRQRSLTNFPAVNETLVAFSGGKDSLAILDLCVSAGLRVEAWYMYFLPGLDSTDYHCELAEKRWKVKVHRYQHWITSYYMRHGVFRLPVDVPKIVLKDVEFAVRQDTGIEWIAYGYKSIDSLQRRAWLNKWPGGISEPTRSFAPLKTWNNTDVLSYLSRRRIPAPAADKRVNGTDLTPESLEALRRDWPRDYRRVLDVFPHAELQAARAARIRSEVNAVCPSS